MAGIVLVPLGVNPVILDVAVAVHAKVAPGTPDVRVTAVVAWPLQIVWFIGVFVTVGRGLTVMVKQVFALLPQKFPAFTQTVPEVVPNKTLTVVVPCPLLIVAPAGTVQL